MAKLVKEAVDKGFICVEDGVAAMPAEPTPGRLYCNPKDHKAVRLETGLPPLRVIVSNSGSSTEGLGKIVDYVVRPVDMAAASYVQDTPHVLRQLDEMNKVGPQRSGTFLFTMDVVDMYPSIPTARGPGVQRTALERAGSWLTG